MIDINEVLSQKESASLGRYFTRGLAGEEGSPLGAILEKMKNFSMCSIPCGVCQHTGVINATGEWCTQCAGTAYLAYERPAHPADEIEGDEEHEPWRTWPYMLIRADVHAKLEPSFEHSALLERAVISRRLNRMPMRLQKALEAFHGHAGMHCGVYRVASLMPLTPAGMTLSALALYYENPMEEEIHHYRRCMIHMTQQSDSKDQARGQLIFAAEKQATELYMEAVKAWLSTQIRGAA